MYTLKSVKPATNELVLRNEHTKPPGEVLLQIEDDCQVLLNRAPVKLAELKPGDTIELAHKIGKILKVKASRVTGEKKSPQKKPAPKASPAKNKPVAAPAAAGDGEHSDDDSAE